VLGKWNGSALLAFILTNRCLFLSSWKILVNVNNYYFCGDEEPSKTETRLFFVNSVRREDRDVCA
jgi:hypothetical protein